MILNSDDRNAQFYTTDMDKTRLSCLVLSLFSVGGVNRIGENSRLSVTENFETENALRTTENSLDL